MLKYISCSIDKDGSLSLDWTEWRNFFQLYPSGDFETMLSFWRKSLVTHCTNPNPSLTHLDIELIIY